MRSRHLHRPHRPQVLVKALLKQRLRPVLRQVHRHLDADALGLGVTEGLPFELQHIGTVHLEDRRLRGPTKAEGASVHPRAEDNHLASGRAEQLVVEELGANGDGRPFIDEGVACLERGEALGACEVAS